MAHYRVDRLREQMKAEISDILRREMKDPRLGFVSVTDVEVSQDLRHAKVYVSILGDETAKKDTIDALQGAAGFVRTEIARRIRLRHTPEIIFRLDESIERGARIFELLEQVKGDAVSEGEGGHSEEDRK